MRYFWIGGIVLIGLLGAGCSSGSTSGTTTTAAGKSATTVAAGSLTPTAKDKEACAKFVALKSGSASTADIHQAAKALRKANYAKLRAEGRAWAGALVHKHKSAETKAEARITAICTEMGLG